MYAPPSNAASENKALPAKKPIRSTLVSRNVTIAGHRTSVRLEPDMWSGLIEACRRERITLHDLCTRVARNKNDETSLTAAIRVYVMNYYRSACTEEGHFKAGHGSGMRMSVPVHVAHAAASLPASAQPHSLQSPGLQTPGTTSPTSPSKPFMIGMGRMTNSGSIR